MPLGAVVVADCGDETEQKNTKTPMSTCEIYSGHSQNYMPEEGYAAEHWTIELFHFNLWD
jgi:hypothetical protein